MIKLNSIYYKISWSVDNKNTFYKAMNHEDYIIMVYSFAYILDYTFLHQDKYIKDFVKL